MADQIKAAMDHGQEGYARVDAPMDAHVKRVRSLLAAEPDLAAKVDAGELLIAGARYELTTQQVRRPGSAGPGRRPRPRPSAGDRGRRAVSVSEPPA